MKILNLVLKENVSNMIHDNDLENAKFSSVFNDFKLFVSLQFSKNR